MEDESKVLLAHLLNIKRLPPLLTLCGQLYFMELAVDFYRLPTFYVEKQSNHHWKTLQ